MDKARLERQITIACTRWDLTPRQLEVMRLIARGLSNGQIATSLKISERTVEVHITAIFVRTRCTSRSELIATIWAG
jgi:two-component system, NarL family, response regulator LiaR